MIKQDNLVLKEGETQIVDEQGKLLFTVELTPNMIVVVGVDNTTLLRAWRDILDWRHNATKNTGS